MNFSALPIKTLKYLILLGCFSLPITENTIQAGFNNVENSLDHSGPDRTAFSEVWSSG